MLRTVPSRKEKDFGGQLGEEVSGTGSSLCFKKTYATVQYLQQYAGSHVRTPQTQAKLTYLAATPNRRSIAENRSSSCPRTRVVVCRTCHP